jgi:ADP-heptose:LPS heptosyltransferase
MALEINAKMLRALGFESFKSSTPIINAPNEDLIIPKNYFIGFMGGSSIVKRWRVDRWYEVAKHVAKVTGYDCVLAGDTEELSQESYFRDKNEFKYYNYIGKTTLNELIYLISKAKFVLGNDTSAIHIASSVKVKSLCVSSAASGERFYPYKADNLSGYEPDFIRKKVDCEGCSFDKDSFIKCVKGKTNDPLKHCLRDISASDFIEKFNEFITKV